MLMNDYFKRLLSMVLTMCMLASNMCLGVVYGADDTDDTNTEVVEISNADELYKFAERVNNGEITLNAVLTADIVVNDGEITADSTDVKAWPSIGDSIYKYNGVFDGDGHTISGLYYSSTYNYYVGLFGYTDSNAEIKNVGVINSYFSDFRYIGGVCGYNTGTISNSYNTGAVTGSGWYVGGVCGYNDGTISNSYNTGVVTGSGWNVGGVCGYNTGTINNSYNTGAVTGDGWKVGGVCGYNTGMINNTYNTGAITCGSDGVGGVCGYNEGTISNSYNTGKLTDDESYVYSLGSICGYNSSDCKITNCYYLTDTADTDIGSDYGKSKIYVKTNAEFASGEICYILNGSVSGGKTWHQTLGEDEYPVLDASHSVLYLSGTQYCPSRITNFAYTNESDKLTVKNVDHTYKDGICRYCGSYEPANYSESIGSYEIGNYSQLLWFAELVNAGETDINAVLTADIVANEETMTADSTDANVWTPIGDSIYKYNGVFDGQGHTVSGLYFNNSTVRYVGLFGYTDSNAQIKNVGVINSYLKGKNKVGGICGYNFGTISNSYNTGTVTGYGNIGGVSGENAGTISDSYNTGEVTGSDFYVGGICGNNGGTVSKSYNKGAITCNSGEVGGICGYNVDGTVSNNYNLGTVKGNDEVGGVCGRNYGGTISNSYSIGIVDSNSNYAGGVCGNSNTTDGVITNCFYLEDAASVGIGNDVGTSEITVKTSEEFASGEVCYLLNDSVSGGEVWYQTIDTDGYPIFDSTHGNVYAIKSWLCPSDLETVGYNNEGDTTVTESEEHTYAEDNKCKYCGVEKIFEPSVIDGVYQITSRSELVWFVNAVNGGNNAINAVLKADIELNADDEWTPIGTLDIPYSGTFDGDGHTISGVTISGTSSNVGLFGYTAESAVIKNLGVVDSTVSGNENVGAICGFNEGTITACYTTAEVSGADNVGGICGINRGTVSHSYHTDGEVVGSELIAGGISGENTGTITNCFNTASVSSEFMAGSISGTNDGTITACYYLTDTAESGIGDDNGTAEAKTAEQFGSGEVCYLLNNSSDVDVMFYQTVTEDTTPSLDKRRGIVRKSGESYINNLALGDINCDDVVDSADAEILLKYVSGAIGETEFEASYNADGADYNEDDNVDILDVIAILADIA
jgi:hypothetical protein